MEIMMVRETEVETASALPVKETRIAEEITEIGRTEGMTVISPKRAMRGMSRRRVRGPIALATELRTMMAGEPGLGLAMTGPQMLMRMTA